MKKLLVFFFFARGARELSSLKGGCDGGEGVDINLQLVVVKAVHREHQIEFVPFLSREPYSFFELWQECFLDEDAEYGD